MNFTQRILALVLLLAPMAVGAATTYEIDPSHTYPNFTVDHLGFSTMHGQFEKTTGTIVVDKDGDQSMVDVTIQAASIDTGHTKRDEHLRGSDFFNVEEYPEITYKSKDVRFYDDGTATVIGDLTMLGETRQVTLTVDHMKCGPHPLPQYDVEVCGFNAHASLERSNFGMSKYVPGIGDQIDIRLEVEAHKKE